MHSFRELRDNALKNKAYSKAYDLFGQEPNYQGILATK